MEIPIGDTSFKGIRSERGQGTIEYLLILIIMVALILSSVWQFNSAFKSWANNYFGNYLSCLLETGELPTIGGAPGDSSICNELFEAFDISKGRPLKPGGAASGSSSEKQGSSRGANEGSAGRGGGGTSGGNYGRVGRWNTGSAASAKLAAGNLGKKSGDEDNGKTGSVGISSTSAGYRNQRGLSGERITVLDNTSTLDEKEKDKNKRTKVATNTVTGREARTKVMMPAPRKPASKDGETGDESGFNFSNFLRYLLIGGIIIAIVIFLGGQILAMSKASE